jgi:hypothetical protein
MCSPEVGRPWALKVDRDISQGMRPRGFEGQAVSLKVKEAVGTRDYGPRADIHQQAEG